MRLTTTKGTEYYIDDFSFGHTYGGLIVGSPNKEMNLRIINRMEVPWPGGWELHTIQPPDSTIASVLPQYICYAWLRKNETIKDEHADGSHAFIGWLTDINPFDSFEKVFLEQLERLDWKAIATDFEF